MGNLLSTISGQFGKSVAFACVLPAVIFVTVWLYFGGLLLPSQMAALGVVSVNEPKELAAVSLFAILVAGLLYNFETRIVRLYEGYPWERSWFGRAKVAAHQAVYEGLRARSTALYDLAKELPEGDARLSRLSHAWSEIRRRLRREFPDKPDLILPTRLGNTMRSLERYPTVEYGMDAIVLWPRLIAVIDKDYAALLDDTWMSLAFVLNLSLLSGCTAIVLVAVGAAHGPPSGVTMALACGLFLALAYAFYALSIQQASSWGELVKGACDLYRSKLLSQMGYRYDPADRKVERILWGRISEQMMFGDSPAGTGPRVAYVPPPAPACSVTSRPTDAGLEVTRGVKGSIHGVLTVAIGIRNVDPEGRTAADLVLHDVLPDGTHYELGSAAAGARSVRSKGSNPYDFCVGGDLAAGEEIVVTYRAIIFPGKET